MTEPGDTADVPADTAAGDMTGQIAVTVIGSGPRVLLVHGAMASGTQSWEKQRVLSERWTLVMPDRRGYGNSPPTQSSVESESGSEFQSDFEVDAADVAELLHEPAHLVGHSYGAIVALFAAARRPDRVRSLTVIEPPAHSLMRGDENVERQIATFVERKQTMHEPADFYRGFLEEVGVPIVNVEQPLSAGLERNVRVLMNERAPWDRRIPVEALGAAPFPKLVVSGGHNPIFELLCDELASSLGPRAQRAVIAGKAHSVQRTGNTFNERLETFLTSAQA